LGHALAQQQTQPLGGASRAAFGRHGRRGLLATIGMAFLVAPLLLTGPAQAATTLTLTTAEKPLDIPLQEPVEPYSGLNQGWWSSETGHDGDGYDNPNYATGWNDFNGVQRGFYTFHLGRVTRKITSATLLIPAGRVASRDASEVVAFWDVSTPAAGLNRGTAQWERTLRDLGGGTKYGETAVSTATGDGAVVKVRLNGKAVAALTQAKGSRYFSVGASVTTLNGRNGEEVVFAGTGDAAVSLVLTTT
jgi:hypothetical protein